MAAMAHKANAALKGTSTAHDRASKAAKARWAKHRAKKAKKNSRWRSKHHFAKGPEHEIMNSNSAFRVLPDPENPEDFTTPNQKAKSAGVDIDDVAKRIHRIVREEHLDYEQLRYLFRKVRSLAGIRQEKKQRKLPKLLSDAELNRFFDDDPGRRIR